MSDVKFGEVCEHGSLKRQCSLCEALAEIAVLRATVEAREKASMDYDKAIMIAIKRAEKAESALAEAEKWKDLWAEAQRACKTHALRADGLEKALRDATMMLRRVVHALPDGDLKVKAQGLMTRNGWHGSILRESPAPRQGEGNPNG